MNLAIFRSRSFGLIVLALGLLLAFAFVVLRAGPLAPIPVTTAKVESQSLRPALFGVGTIDAERTYRVGPTFAGRVRSLTVNVGDQVVAGQTIGEMDPVDLDDRLVAQASAMQGAEASVREASARQAYAASEASRYESLLAARATSEEVLAAKQQELVSAKAAAARRICSVSS